MITEIIVEEMTMGSYLACQVKKGILMDLMRNSDSRYLGESWGIDTDMKYHWSKRQVEEFEKNIASMTT